MFTIEDLGLGKVDSGVVIKSAFGASAFLGAGTNVGEIPVGGLSFPRLSGLQGFGIGEGEAKIASGLADAITMDARKIQVSTVWTEEVLASKSAIVDAAWNQMPGVVAKTFDEILASLVAKPASWANVPTFGDATLEIGTGADAGVDLDDVKAAVASGDADVFVMTTSMLAYLSRQRIAATGARVFEIVKDSDSKNSGTIDGIAYRTIKSSVAKGVALDSARLFVSLTPFNDPTTGSPYRLKNQGSITDTNGVTHNLTSENKYAVIYEALVGVAFDVTEFPVFAPATV